MSVSDKMREKYVMFAKYELWDFIYVADTGETSGEIECEKVDYDAFEGYNYFTIEDRESGDIVFDTHDVVDFLAEYNRLAELNGFKEESK